MDLVQRENSKNRFFVIRKWYTIDEKDLLNYAISQGIIDISSIQEKLDMKEKEEILKNHPYSIWQGKNGYWYTRLDDDKKGKVLKKEKPKMISKN